MAQETMSASNTEAAARVNMERLRLNPYPGRGIVMGFDTARKLGIQIYWVMGRSENSRNRVLVQDTGIVKTMPFDASRVIDSSLIIYNAMIAVNGHHIVSNGDQTDTIAEALKKKKTFEDAIRMRSYEPDKPNYTPRISGVLFTNGSSPHNEPSIILSKIVKNGDVSKKPNHHFHTYELASLRGIGKCLHTYEGNGDPLPSFRGIPYDVLLEGSIDQLTSTFWDLLNKENRVALAVKTIDLASKAVDFRIANQLS